MGELRLFLPAFAEVTPGGKVLGVLLQLLAGQLNGAVGGAGGGEDGVKSFQGDVQIDRHVLLDGEGTHPAHGVAHQGCHLFGG